MKILLFGKNGQVGWELQRSLASLGELVALETANATMCGDLTDADGLVRTIQTVKPDVIVNAAAYTAVDKAEQEQERAYKINAQAPALMAREAKKSGAWLVHYSTDYVFDGSGTRPWQESDLTAPLNIYGKSKAEGEQAIAANGCAHLIFRTSWVYGVHGSNFLKTILRLGKERETLSIIDDQTGAPTGADLIADVTAHALRLCSLHPDKGGLYHLAASGACSWYDYACTIVALAHEAKIDLKTSINAITAIKSRDFPTAAQRPLNSRLDTTKLTTQMGLHLPDWKMGVERALKEIWGY